MEQHSEAWSKEQYQEYVRVSKTVAELQRKFGPDVIPAIVKMQDDIDRLERILRDGI